MSDHTTSGCLRERQRRDEWDGSGLERMGVGYWGTWLDVTVLNLTASSVLSSKFNSKNQFSLKRPGK